MSMKHEEVLGLQGIANQEKLIEDKKMMDNSERMHNFQTGAI